MAQISVLYENGEDRSLSVRLTAFMREVIARSSLFRTQTSPGYQNGEDRSLSVRLTAFMRETIARASLFRIQTSVVYENGEDRSLSVRLTAFMREAIARASLFRIQTSVVYENGEDGSLSVRLTALTREAIARPSLFRTQTSVVYENDEDGSLSVRLAAFMREAIARPSLFRNIQSWVLVIIQASVIMFFLSSILCLSGYLVTKNPPYICEVCLPIMLSQVQNSIKLGMTVGALMEILKFAHWYVESMRRSGLSESHLGRIPKTKYGSLGVEKSYNCGICLELIEDEDEIRLLHSCQHYYHISCIDQWLQRCRCCPVCRRNVTRQNPSVA